MQLHEVLSASLSNRKRVRVGRGPGSGLGKTSGRGREGATSRSGWSLKADYEGGQRPLFRRLPKRGFRNGPFRTTYALINVCDLGQFAPGTRVGEEQLRAAGLLNAPHRAPLKILGDGELSVALTVVADRFSKSAVEKIAKAGGQVEWRHGAPSKPAPDFAALARKKVAQAAEGKPAAPSPKPKKAPAPVAQPPAAAPPSPAPPSAVPHLQPPASGLQPVAAEVQAPAPTGPVAAPVAPPAPPTAEAPAPRASPPVEDAAGATPAAPEKPAARTRPPEAVKGKGAAKAHKPQAKPAKPAKEPHARKTARPAKREKGTKSASAKAHKAGKSEKEGGKRK